MEALRRWTSSAFLLLALNICRITSQNVRPQCPLPAQALQGETLRDCNVGLVNPQLQMNNLLLYPPNGLAPQGPTAPLPTFQDRTNTQCSLNPQANFVPISQSSCADLGPLNGQTQQCLQISGPIGTAFNIPGPLNSCSQPILSQNQCPTGSQTTSLPQQNFGLERLPPPQGPFLPFTQGILPGPLPTIAGPPLAPFTSTPCPGIEVWPVPQQGFSEYSQTDSLPYNRSPLVNNFTPLVPISNPGLLAPCADGQVPYQGFPLPSSLPQGLSPTCPSITPLIPLNNDRVLVDGSDCLPKAHGPQCDIVPETEPCPATFPPSIVPQTQNSLPISQFNMFRLPRPTLFQPAFQSPSYDSLSLQCDINNACPSINTQDQGFICDNAAPIQQETVCQVPTAPATCMPNIQPGLANPNIQLFPLQYFPVSQPALSSNPCPMINDVSSANILPSPIISQPFVNPLQQIGTTLPQFTNSIDCTITPLNESPPCFSSALPSVLPTFFSGPSTLCDIISPYQPSIAENTPIPINLQINVPPPVIPAPRITIINATPAPETPASTVNKEASYFDLPYPLPPIIIEDRRSSSRSWLPLALVALFACDGNFGGCGGCSCDSGPIPVPYPIAIPTNNPVIVN